MNIKQKAIVAHLCTNMYSNGRTPYEQFVKKQDYSRQSLVLAHIIRTQGTNPQVFGRQHEQLTPQFRFPELSEMNSFVYGEPGFYFDKRQNQVLVFHPENDCLPTEEGECDADCDGFTTSRTEKLKPYPFSIGEPLCSPGFSLTNEDWKQCKAPGDMPAAYDRGITKELNWMYSKMSKKAFEFIQKNADTPIYEGDGEYFKVKGNKVIVHQSVISNADFPVKLEIFLRNNGINNPAIYDCGALQSFVSLAGVQSGSADVYGTAAAAWAKFDITDVMPEFVTSGKNKMFTVYDIGSLMFGNWNEFEAWHKVPDKDYYRGPALSPDYPIVFDMLYKFGCAEDKKTFKHDYKLQAYPKFNKRVNGCPQTCVDFLCFEVGCFPIYNSCDDSNPTCKDIEITKKAIGQQPGMLTIPQNPIEADLVDGFGTFNVSITNQGTACIYDAMDNYTNEVNSLPFTDTQTSDAPIDLPPGSYMIIFKDIQFNITDTSGMVIATCVKNIKCKNLCVPEMD